MEPPLCIPPSALVQVSVERVATLKGHRDRVWCVRWCPAAMVLASSSGDATVKLWARDGREAAAELWNCIATLEGEHSRTVRHISWSPSGEYLACASFDHTATVWRRGSSDAWEYVIEGVLDGQESELKCVEWATETTLLTSSRDHTVWLWDRVEEGDYECAGVLTGHVQDVKHCRWLMPCRDGEGPRVVSCSYDDTIKVWGEGHRADDWQCIQTLTAHTATVWATALQKVEVSLQEAQAAQTAGQLLPQPLLCSCSDDLNLIFWKRDAEGHLKEVARTSGFAERSLYDVDWAPHGEAMVACASGDNSFSLIGLHQDGEGVHVSTLFCQRDAHEADVNSICFAPEGAEVGTVPQKKGLGDAKTVLMATGGDDGVVHLWRIQYC